MFTFLLIAAAAVASQPAQAPEPSAAVLAQALDRCMTTHAVRLTRTSATDDAIYTEAAAGCKALNEQLGARIAQEYTPAQAAELTTMLEAQAKPNFLSLLQRIRADRRFRAGN